MKISFQIVLGLLVLAFTVREATSAQAQNWTLTTRDGTGPVLVWKSEAATKEAIQLGQAGNVDPVLFMPLIACVVTVGTPIIITSGGMFTSDVLVTRGTAKGCRGNVTSNAIASR